MLEEPDQVALWLREAHAGSRQALGQLFDVCLGYLLLVARNEFDPKLQAKGAPSDLIQETYLEAQRDFAQFQGTSQEELQAWLRRLLLNNLSNFNRNFREAAKRTVNREVSFDFRGSGGQNLGQALSADTPSPSGHALANEERDALERALQRLPADYQRVIRLRYEEEKPFAEIADIMQRSPNAVRKLWARAIELLQKEMEPSP
jgi:RNA polymerase sigma-70 factor (ECF subfamily)